MQKWHRSLRKILVIAVVASLVMSVRPTFAMGYTSVKDTLTRLKTSTTADHTIQYTIPPAVDFDVTGSTDVFVHDFQETGGGFTQGGTWATADFTFDDGTVRTIDAVSAGAGTTTVACTNGANNVGVAIDTTAIAFRVIPCGAGFTASAVGATVKFTIDGTTVDGTLTNPASVGTYTLKLAMTDEGSVNAHGSDVAIAIVDDDTVSISATVDPTLTFDIDTAVTDTEDPSPYEVALTSITTGAVRSSDASTNSIWMDLATNATNGATITVINTDASTNLVSTSVPTDFISSVATPGTTAVTAGTEGYGICVVSATSSGAAANLTIADVNGEYDGTSPGNDGCTADTVTDNVVGVPPVAGGTPDTLISETAAPITSGRIRVAVKAAISGATEARPDYADGLVFIATGTF